VVASFSRLFPLAIIVSIVSNDLQTICKRSAMDTQNLAPEFRPRAENLLLPDRFKAQASITVTLSIVTQSEKLDNVSEFVISCF
jgi:hypothetical protein